MDKVCATIRTFYNLVFTRLSRSLVNLEMHKRTHTGGKRFKCDVCWKGFSKQSGLVTHKRGTHWGKAF